MKINNLTEDEKLIEKEIDILKPISGQKKEKVSKIIAKAKKNRSISLRVSNYDLEKIKEKANAEGIPYQTLINSVLHKYITDQLFEKDQVIKSFNLISKS
ncbi:MAG: CopG family antitoxin [Nanoarchaeota archaeon]